MLNSDFSKNIVYFDEKVLKGKKHELIKREETEEILNYIKNYDKYLLEIGFIILILIILLLISVTSMIIYYKTQSSMKNKVENFLAHTKFKLSYWRNNKACIEKKNKFMKIKFSDYYE